VATLYVTVTHNVASN